MRVPGVPPVGDALNRWLIVRWRQRGRCAAMHPDTRAHLQCMEIAGHEKDGIPHTATMAVKW